MIPDKDAQIISRETQQQQDTLALLRSNGLGELVEACAHELNLVSFEERSEIPIPLSLIPQSETELDLGSDVSDTCRELLNIMEEPQHAFEYPFFIGGFTSSQNILSLESLALLYPEGTTFHTNSTLPDKDLLGKAVSDNVEKGGNVHVLGHTHPEPSNETKEESVAAKLSAETKTKYGIRDVGLNISLNDIYQLVSFRSTLEERHDFSLTVMICVLMFNGEIHFIYIENDKLLRITKEISSD
ncbi:hypothetical protein JW710_02070 [Candidatus Dojkabacteria bacterium]|nr:hypothetical protein [Candidatus Dojkabacteria bacterium]